MARKTPAELTAARKAKDQGRRSREQEDERERLAAATVGGERLRRLRDSEERAERLESVLKGCYEEIDKLTKKAPADEVTELQFNMVNNVIQQCKHIMADDEYIDAIDVFVAAGECPEYRDVLFVLRQLRQGLQRMKEERGTLEARAKKEQWPEARFSEYGY